MIVFDARADIYETKNIMADGVSLLFLSQANSVAESPNIEVERLFKYYQFDSVFILKNRPLYVYLKSHPEKYRLLYEEETMAYFTIIKQ